MIGNAIQLALREIKRNVLRSFLTLLGIVIGVAAVITMVTIGNGVTAQVTKQISSLGSNALMISPGKRSGPGRPFRPADAEAILREIPSLSAVAPSASRSITAIFGNENWSTTVTGIDNQFFIARNWPVKEGRRFSDSELRAGAAVCLVGTTVKTKLSGKQQLIGSVIRLNKLSCEVIGVLDAKGQSSRGTDQDDLVLAPLRMFQRRVSGNQDIGLIQVSVREGVSTKKVQQDISRLMRERRHLSKNEDNDFEVTDTKEITKMLTSTTRVLTALLGTVAAVSLLVGGIGIMNIMLVSVTERTREIGTRLAIGALEREVLLQFLVEAVVLSLIGGVIGIMLGLMAAVGGAALLKVPFIFSPGIILIAFAFSGAIGVLFGYFPARKAARLNPIDALRYE